MTKKHRYSIQYQYDSLDRLTVAVVDKKETYQYNYDQTGSLKLINYSTYATAGIEGTPLPSPDNASWDKNNLPRWFISRGNQRYGPYSWNDLVSFVPQKRLLKEDLVWCEDWESWVLAETINGLF